MTLLIIRPAAEADIEEASDWYEEQERGLGGRFLDELRDTFARVRRAPLQFPDVGRNLRRALLHQRCSPGTWRRRLRTKGKAR